MYTVYVDESGTLPDKNDRIIIVAAVSTQFPQKIENIFKKIKKNRKFKELKFYYAGDKTKQIFFENLVKEDVEIFILSVNKNNRKIEDSPENFAILCWILLNNVLNFYPKSSQIVFDRHFSSMSDIVKFNIAIKKLLSKTIKIQHIDSEKNQIVNVSDMVAGAVFANETGKNSLYYKLIKSKIVTRTDLNWTEAKKIFINKKLA